MLERMIYAVVPRRLEQYSVPAKSGDRASEPDRLSLRRVIGARMGRRTHFRRYARRLVRGNAGGDPRSAGRSALA